jgi:hypothetical protein
MRSIFAAAALLAATLPAAAVQVRECDYAADIRSIAEPWEKNTRAFYNGMVRVAVSDTGGEPVCCSMHLVILIPDRANAVQGMDEGRVCRIVGDKDGMGFVGIDFQRLRTRYDAGRGLLIEFPYQLYVDGLKNRNGVGRVRVNIDKGTVTAE